MSSRGKCQIVFFFITSFICEEMVSVASQITIAVLFSSGKSRNPSTATFPITIKKYFEKIPSTLDIEAGVNFVYKDLNSTFCDVGTFLAFVDGILARDVIVVLLLESCQCEKMFMSYLDTLNIKTISSCEPPLFIAKGASSIIKQVHKEKHLYLVVPADAYGVEFYQDFTFQLQRQKLKLHRTLWVGGESVEGNQLQKELRSAAENIDNNITSGAAFVLGFLHPNDFRLKSLVNVAKRILGNQLGEILWIFPVIHLDISNMRTFDKSFQALAFWESNTGSVHCNNHNEICALHLVLETTSYVLKSCWGKELPRENVTIHNRNATTTVFESSALAAERADSVKNQECKTSQHSCYIDVLQLTTDHYIGDITWKRIGTWNGDTVQPCSSEDVSNDAILSPKIKTVFRVPTIAYFPFIVKHELSSFSGGCPAYSLPCYAQRRKADNSTVINYADKYCCSGWTVDVLIYLTDKLSYEFELYFQAEQLFGVYDNITGKWNGVIQDIVRGQGDIAVDLGNRPDRCAVLDCSLGYLFDGFNVIVRLEFSEKDSPEKDSFRALVGNFQIFLNPFHVDLLVVVLMIFNVFLFLIWATDKICLSYRNKRRTRKKEKFTLLESTSYVWATAFGRDVGDSKKPLTLSARYLASWLAFLSLIFVNVYVARLMAEIVEQEPTKPFTNLQDPEILNRNLKLGVVKGSSMEAYFHNTRDPVLKQSFENNIKENLLSSLDEGVEAVKNGTLDGFIADTVSLVTILNQDPNCSLSLMGRDFSINPVGFMFRKGWPWAEEFKLQELRMNADKRSEDLWKMKQEHRVCEAPSQEHPQLSAADMSGLFLVLIFAVAYCCFSLILENIHSLLVYRYQNSNADWNVPHNHSNNVTASNVSLVRPS